MIDLNNRPKKCLNYLTPNEVHFGISINIENTKMDKELKRTYLQTK
ncbi:hypothetical protein ACP8HZ_03825 [Francisella noatunensis]